MKLFGSMIRSALAVIISLVVAFVLVVALEGASAVLHPLPAEFDGSQNAMLDHVANYPNWVLAIVVVIWGATTFVSTPIDTAPIRSSNFRSANILLKTSIPTGKYSRMPVIIPGQYEAVHRLAAI